MWEKILFTTSTGKTRKAIYLKQWRYPHCHVVCLRSRDWFNWCYCCSESQKVQPQRVEIQTWEENFFSNDCVYCNYSDLCYANSNSQCVTVSLGLWYQCVMSLIYNWKVVQKTKCDKGSVPLQLLRFYEVVFVPCQVFGEVVGLIFTTSNQLLI